MSLPHPTSGEGLKEVYNWLYKRIKHTLEGPRTGPTKRFTNFLDTTGNQQIVKLELAQKPVESHVELALNALSAGNYDRKKKELGYDTVNHNYLIVSLANGKTYVVHKNEVVSEREATAADLRNSRYDIPLPADHSLTLKHLVDTAAKTDLGKPATKDSEREFWQYNPRDKNCQDFTRQLILDNGLHPTDPATLKAMEPQDGHALIGSLGENAHIPHVITTAASVLDRTIHGDGLTVRKRILRRHHYET